MKRGKRKTEDGVDLLLKDIVAKPKKKLRGQLDFEEARNLIGCFLPKQQGRIPVALIEFEKVRKAIPPSRLPKGFTAGWNERLEPVRLVKLYPSTAAFNRWRKRQRYLIFANDCWEGRFEHLLS